MLEVRLKQLLPTSIPVVIGELPSSSTDIVAMVLYNGNANTEYFGKSTVFQPVVKFVARHSSYEVMRSWIDQIQRTLHQHHDEYFLGIHLVGSPTYLGRGSTKLHEMQIVFRLEVKE